MSLKCGLFISLLITAIAAARAQSPDILTGNVTRKEGGPLAMVTVILLKDTGFLAAGITNEKGNFFINAPLQKDSTYILQLSLVGFQTMTQLFRFPDPALSQKLVLTNEGNTLKTVVILSSKQIITRKADRYVINVENSYLANTGNALDVLQRSPGLWVTTDGSIRLKGNQPVMVMINDVVQRMSPEELAEYLKSLASESISKIEVIQNPPAEYEAAGTGGIVHIILKKARKDGFNGVLNSNYRVQGNNYFVSSGASVDYKLKRIYLSVNGSLSKDENASRALSKIIYPDNSIYNTNGTRDNDNRRQLYRFTMGYDIAARHFIGLQHMRVANQFFNTFNTTSFYKDNYNEVNGTAFTNWQRKPVFIASTLNYAWKIDSLGSQLKMIVDRTHGNKYEMNALNAVYNLPAQNLHYRIFTPITTDIYTLQADLVKHITNKMQWSTGIKFAATGKDNQLIREDAMGGAWIKDSLVSNHFRYDERLLMLYAAVEKTIGKTALKAGLRAEETLSKGRSITSGEQFRRRFTDLFPSFFLTQSINETRGHSWHISYSRRVERPGFRELNPYRLQFDNQTIMLGNPHLLPQYTHAIEAGLSWRRKYDATVYYAVTNNVIGQLASPVAGNIIEYQYQNLDKNKEYGLNISLPVTLLKNWQVSNNISAYQSAYIIHDHHLKQSTLALKTTHSIALKQLADIDVMAEYRSPYVNANTVYAAQFSCDLSISKRILNNKGRVRLYCSDIANTAREKETTKYAGTNIFFYQKRQTRNAGLSFIYNLSAGKKFTSKKIEPGNTDR
jgi:hypothetical protein